MTFSVPRASLVRAVEWEIFDDLLIGNFMQTTLHGSWPSSGLYPGFTPWVTKYADNGRARSDAELREYFAEYRRRLGFVAWLRGAVEQRAKDAMRSRVSADSLVIPACPSCLRAREGWRLATGAALGDARETARRSGAPAA